ncbi:MAG: GNAT family N-acetyltransferase [Actinomycetota bacterium]
MRTSPIERYVDAVCSAAAQHLGTPVGEGTVVVSAAERAGSTTAVAYPLGSRTIVWCAPELADRLLPLDGPTPLTAEQYVDAAEGLGGTFAAGGRNRLLVAKPPAMKTPVGRIVELDRDHRRDRSRIADFLAACPADDVDDAEIDIDDLDPVISVVIEGDERIVSFASARDWQFDPGFGDIGVLTHPEHRGRRLGAAAVSHIARRLQSAGRVPYYNHNDDNLGSQRIADVVGFETVTALIAMTFS